MVPDRIEADPLKVLVLGGSGFVSGAILHTLREAGLDVTALTRGVTPTDWGTQAHITCDRSDRAAMRAALTDRYDVVVDVTGFNGEDVDIVLDGLPTLPDAYVFVSSAAVYDSATTSLPFREDHGLGGDAVWGDYGVDKLRAEEVLQATMGDRAFVLRPPYIYGPGNNLDREDFLWARLLESRPVLVPGSGETEIQFCHIDSVSDFVRRVVTGANVAAGAYNIGDERSYSFREYIGLLAEVAGTAAPDFRFVERTDIKAREYFPFRDSPLVLDTTKWTATGEAHVVPFTEGLARTLAWFRSSGTLTFEPGPLECE